MGHLLGAEIFFFLIRDIDDATRAGASVETCQSVALRSPGGRIGSVLDMGSRLHRMRGRFHRCIHVSMGHERRVVAGAATGRVPRVASAELEAFVEAGVAPPTHPRRPRVVRFNSVVDDSEPETPPLGS